MPQIRYEPPECDCNQPWCANLHSGGWWVGNIISFETKEEAEAFVAAQCKQDGHVFEVGGPTPGKCTFCGHTPEPTS